MAKKSRARSFGKKVFLFFNLLVSLLFLYPIFFRKALMVQIHQAV